MGCRLCGVVEGKLWKYVGCKVAKLYNNYKLQLQLFRRGVSTTFRSAWVSRLKCNICPRYRKLGALLPQLLSIYVRLPFGVSMSHCKMPLVLKPRFLRFYVPLHAASKRERVTNEISKDNLTS